MRRLYLIIYITILVVTVKAQTQVRVMSLNCENAFDIYHDEGKNDYEYVQGGTRNWNKGRFYHKLNGIAQLIAATDTVNPVPLVALCEVENDSVLDYLVHRTPLRTIGYKYVMTASPDQRGVDVALLYKQEIFAPIEVQRLRPEHVGTPTRDILHVTGIVGVDDTLDVYAVHLPSKLGGKQAIQKSLQVTGALKENVDSVLASRQNGRVVIMGDYNAEYDSKQFHDVFHAEKYWGCKEHKDDVLYDVIEGGGSSALGSYKYKGKWSVIDHILVNGSVQVKDAGILSSPFILEKDDLYGGVKPKRTYTGYKYNGGISDHLPVWAVLVM